MKIGIDLDGVVIDSETTFRTYEEIFDIDILKGNNLINKKEPKFQARYNWTNEQEKEFIEKYFIEEIPQKFKFAYLQYYYLCDFIKEFSVANNIGIGLNSSFKNRGIRNCLAHYGLGQFLSEDDVIEDDVLKGLTYKAFGMDYNSTKEHLFEYLRELTEQIKYMIF